MDEATRRDWGRRIKERRKGLGLSQDQLGAAAGTNQATISKLERGLMPVISDDLKWKVSGGLRAPVGDVFPYPAVLPPLSKPEALVS